jgi:plasmid stabilization system protein ParE
MNLRILPAAIQDLDEIDSYLGETFGKSTAAQVSAKLFHIFQLLDDFPDMGRSRQDVTSQPIRFFLVKPYWILYEPGNPLTIHRVFHAARDLARLPQS